MPRRGCVRAALEKLLADGLGDSERLAEIGRLEAQRAEGELEIRVPQIRGAAEKFVSNVLRTGGRRADEAAGGAEPAICVGAAATFSGGSCGSASLGALADFLHLDEGLVRVAPAGSPASLTAACTDDELSARWCESARPPSTPSPHGTRRATDTSDSATSTR